MTIELIGENRPISPLFRSLKMYAAIMAMVLAMLCQIAQAGTVKQLPLSNIQQGLQSSEYYDLSESTRLIAENDCSGAIKMLNLAIEKNPNNIIAYYNQGTCYYQMAKQADDISLFHQQMNEARKAYERVQLLDPRLMVTYFKLGKIAVTQRKPEDAIAIYKKGLEYNQNAALYFNLAGVYDNQNEYTEAIKYYQMALEKDPNFIYAHNNLGLAYEILNDTEKAESAYRQALKIKSDYTFARLNLGNLLAQKDEFKAAKREYNKVLKASPDNAWAHLYLGNVYYQEGNSHQALKAYEKSQQLNPGYAAVYYLKALALRKLSRQPEAMAAGMAYLNLSPRGKYAREMTTMVRKLRILQADANEGNKPLTDCGKTQKICSLK